MEGGTHVKSSIDFDSIRERNPLPEYCRKRGIELRKNGTSGRLVGLCPLHQEKTASFYVYPDNHYHCYGCGSHGDVTELERALRGGTRCEAAGRLGALRMPTGAPLSRPNQTEISVSLSYKLTEVELQLMKQASETLRRKPGLALTVRSELPLQGVEQTAIEGDLGFCHELTFGALRGPALLFGYSHGIKVRWPNKRIRWLVGSAVGECWRGSLMIPSHRTVYITEGEIDALTLTSRGYETPGEAIVVALSSATVLPDAQPFAGKEVVMIPDGDEAGRRCATELMSRLLPIAKSVCVVDLRQGGAQ
jgi:hypothetical protein